jgi:hypothetical protein
MGLSRDKRPEIMATLLCKHFPVLPASGTCKFWSVWGQLALAREDSGLRDSMLIDDGGCLWTRMERMKSSRLCLSVRLRKSEVLAVASVWKLRKLDGKLYRQVSKVWSDLTLLQQGMKVIHMAFPTQAGMAL